MSSIPAKLRLLHTSDWHLGRTLYTKNRHEEHARFLDWLIETLKTRQVEVLLVAGDVFDSNTPGNRAQELYYRFLRNVAATTCRHVVIVAGNHDSPSFIDAPGELLKALHIHVVGSAAANPADEVLLLKDRAGAPELIVCAVPYLRDRDIRTAEAGEDAASRQARLRQAIRSHYAAAADAAAILRRDLPHPVPVVATGHLFAEGGEVSDGDGVRELYIGSLSHTPATDLPALFDYIALGHLHKPQPVRGTTAARYSGAPLAMGFNEAAQRKSVTLVDLAINSPPQITTIDIPPFQALAKLCGDLAAIRTGLNELTLRGESVWVEVAYTGSEIVGDLRRELQQTETDTKVEILKITNERAMASALEMDHTLETLDQLGETEVFQRCLAANQVPLEQRDELIAAHNEILQTIADSDAMTG